MNLRLWLIVVCAAALTACGSSGADALGAGGDGGATQDGGLPDSGAADDAGNASTGLPCAPYATRACTCGSSGVSGSGSERCAWNGKSWGACACATYGLELAVATNGNDAAAGTLSAPFATFERARDAVIALRSKGLPPGGVVVWVRGGVYERSATLTLGASVSGASATPVVFRGFPGETARILGGHRLDTSALKAVDSSSPVWARLDPSAQGHVVAIAMQAQGVTSFGTLKQRGFGSNPDGPPGLELFVDGDRMTLARWPDVGETGPGAAKGFATVATSTDQKSFTYTAARPSRWASAVDPWFHGFWMYSWAEWHIAPSSPIDFANKKVTFPNVPGYGIKAGQPFYAYNLLEEITQPGEWYLDRQSGTLYLWPTKDLTHADVVVSMLETPLLDMNGANFITWQDVSFEAGRADLVRMNNVTNDTLLGCTLRDAGESAVVISGTASGVRYSHLYALGGGGAHLTGGDRKSLTPGADFVEDSHIHDFMQSVWTYMPGVGLDGVGHSVRHNVIHGAPHTAVLFSGNEQVIELNDIHDVCSVSSDAGAVYTGRDWGLRGNIVRNNFIHDLTTIVDGSGVHGVYLDDVSSGISVTGNVLYKISGHGIVSGGGRDNLMTNNVIARCGDSALYADDRGITSVKSTPGDSFNLLEKLQQMAYQSPPWSVRYPACAAIPNSWATISATGALWLYPQGCVFSRNIGFANKSFTRTSNYGGGTTPVLSRYAEVKDNIDDQDPLFVDEASGDLTLKASSPALALPGFVSIPFDKIGIEP